MEGVRVSNIQESVDEKDLKIHFTNTRHGGGQIRQIFFPLLNHDAVIIFKDPGVIDTVVTVQHKIDGKLVGVQRLPPMVFTAIEAKLDPTVSSMLQATEQCQGHLRYAEIDIKHNPTDNCVILKGNWFQMEYAWEVLANYIHKQQSIQMKIYQKKDLRSHQNGGYRETDPIPSLGRTNYGLQKDYKQRHRSYDKNSSGESDSSETPMGEFVRPEVRRQTEAELSSDKNSYRSLHVDDSHETSLKTVADIDDTLPYSSHIHDGLYHHGNSSSSRNAAFERTDSEDFTFNRSSSGSVNRTLKKSDAGNSALKKSDVGTSSQQNKRPDANHSSQHNSYSSSRYRDSDRISARLDHEENLRSLTSRGREATAARNDRIEGKAYDELFPKVQHDRSLGNSSREKYDFETNGDIDRAMQRTPSGTVDVTGSKTYTVLNNRDTVNGYGVLDKGLFSDSDSEEKILQNKMPSNHISSARQRYQDKRTRQVDENETFSKFSEAGKTASLLQNTDYSSINGHSSSVRDPDNVEVLFSSRSKSVEEKPKRNNYLTESMANLGNYYEFNVGELKIVVKCANITSVETAGLVNPANGSLSHGAGVAGAIARAASPLMEMECEEHIRKKGLLNTTDVMHTRAGGRLSPKISHILHAVGPIWIESLPERCKLELIKTYFNCFDHADKLWLTSLTVPCISSGIFGVPLEASIHCFLDGVLLFHSGHQRDLHLKEIHLVNNDPDIVMTSIVMLQSLLEDGQDTATARALESYEKFIDVMNKRHIDKGSSVRETHLGRPYKTADDFSSSTTSRSRAGLDSSTKTSSVHRTASLDRSKLRKASDLPGSSSTRSNVTRSKVTENDKSKIVSERSIGSSSARSKTDVDLSSLSVKGSSTSKQSENDLKPSVRKRSSSTSRMLQSKNSSESKNVSSTKSSLSSSRTGTGSSPRPTGQTGSSGKTSSRSTVLDQLKKSSSSKPSPPQIKSALQKPGLNLSKNASKLKTSTNTNLGKTMPMKAFTHERGLDDYSFKNSHLDSSGLSDLDFMYGSQSLPAHFELDHHRPDVSRQYDLCSICLERVQSPKTLHKCGHTFCSDCIDRHFKLGKPKCPDCGELYGTMTGNQPPGTMTHTVQRSIVVPGYGSADGAIVITYDIPPGTQKSDHPNPGTKYSGLQRKAYLPNNREGKEILRLLKKAFDAKLIFTIGFSRTTGKDGVVTWNDIHHKTNVDGGPQRFGYPDPTYLKRVREELAQFGIK